MYEELTETIFADSTKEEIFYAACISMYRFSLLVSNSSIPPNMKRFKWHLLPLIRAALCGKEAVQLNSKSAAQGAQKIIEIMGQHGPAASDTFSKLVQICQSMGAVTSDRLKRQAILSEMLELI